MTVSLPEILAAAGAHAAPLAAESAGYLLLAVADHVLTAPRAVTAEDVELLADGSVRLRSRRTSSSADESPEQATRRLLGRALRVASSVGPALRRAAERSEDVGLPGLVRELETALIPVNRAAARRALSRLCRETEHAKSAGKLGSLLEAEPAPAAVVAPAPAAVVAPAPAAVSPAEVVAEMPASAPAVAAEPLVMAADFPTPSPLPSPVVAVALPVVAKPAPRLAEPAPAAAPSVTGVVAAPPAPVAEFTPEPQLAVGEPALTKPEPVVQRAKERGNATPRLGTLITLQTLPGEESELTERAPTVVEVEPQPLVDPEPSRLPDVLTAMLELHTGVDADEAPTRIRDVVTEVRGPSPVQAAPEPVRTLPVEQYASEVALPEAELSEPALAEVALPEAQLLDAPLLEVDVVVEDAWLTQSSLSGVESLPRRFESELAEPAVHEALTWDPGPVTSAAAHVPPALVIAEPAPEPSPYAPAVLPARTSDVSELLDTFYVSGGAEESELRSALKGMAGLELTPMPHPLVEER